jgi:hypothetical protein
MKDWHYDLALQQALARAEEQMIAYLMTGWDPFAEDTALGEGAEVSGLTPHQFSRLVAVAMENSAVPVVTNYLRYQIGRSNQGTLWRWQDLGMTLARTLEVEIYNLAQQTAHRAATASGGKQKKVTSAQQADAWIAVTRRFLALLSRRFEQRYRDANL